MNKPVFSKRRILTPVSGSSWAGKMVLNPAMIRDPEDGTTLYMLFRATGPWPQAQLPGCPLPYPIFLGYGVSHDDGETWQFDLEAPAMAPRLEYDEDVFRAHSLKNGVMFDFANGCIEDPRFMMFEGNVFLTVACRPFPPGPYWEHDEPTQCLPGWAKTCDLGKAVTENCTVTLLYRVNLTELSKRNYASAFTLVAPMHQPNASDDRDVVIFPRRLNINGESRIVCLHRPKEPWNYAIGRDLKAPSIFLSTADSFEDFCTGRATEEVFAVPEYPWEANRIGPSWAPIEYEQGKWLLPYHGKQDDTVGYTQSFMLLEETPAGKLTIVSRPKERLLFADQPWEMEGDFAIPCVFTCSGVLCNDNQDLLMGYGAADRVVALAKCNVNRLLDFLKP